jgi:flagellar export protein FliJ
MSGFRFRLDGLLRLRKHQEDGARLELAEAQRKVMGAQADLEDVQAQKNALSAELAAGTCGNVALLQAGYARAHLLRGEEQASRERLASAHAEHEERRDGMVIAHRARQTVQKLQERSLERYLEELRQEESRFSDEVGTGIAARRIQQRMPGRGEVQ